MQEMSDKCEWIITNLSDQERMFSFIYQGTVRGQSVFSCSANAMQAKNYSHLKTKVSKSFL